MILQHFEALYRHMRWADALVWRSVLASPEAQADERTYHLLLHMVQVQRAFLSVWRGEAPQWLELDTFADREALARYVRESHAKLTAHLDGVTEEQLGETMEVAWKRWVEKTIGCPPAPSTRLETMQQVAQHSTYHRGQVNARLRELGVEPPLTDFIAWVWLGKPAAEWPV
ncbi:MAG TPA: DinB family protein [Thermoanaerobaculia bacterium]|nr:DinB family protein [Thermoanaerobaculia bacterium]